jgi:hypothetical protein
MTNEEIYKFGEIQYLKGRLDELNKGYVPHSMTRDNRIVDSRISKYEDKLKNTDEISYYLYQTELGSKRFSKERSKKHIKSLLEEVLTHIDNEEIKNKILNQIEKY